MRDVWRAAFKREGARLLQAGLGAGAVDGQPFADGLWCWAQWVGAGEDLGAVGGPASDAAAALCAAAQGDPIGVDGRGVWAARGLYAWGKMAGDEAMRRKGLVHAEGVFSAVDGYAAGRTELSVWAAVLALCGEVLADGGNRAVHYMAARSVAVLLNDFYQVERGEFLHCTERATLPDQGGQEAELAVQIEAVDALLAEAVRCADERLWAWSNACVRRLAERVGDDERAAEAMRLPAVRIGCERGESWAADWIDRSWCAVHGQIAQVRLRSLVAGLRLLDAA